MDQLLPNWTTALWVPLPAVEQCTLDIVNDTQQHITLRRATIKISSEFLRLIAFHCTVQILAISGNYGANQKFSDWAPAACLVHKWFFIGT